MRTWNVVALLLVVAFVAAPCVQAQSDDDLRQEIKQMKADLQKVMKANADIADENARLRTKVDSMEVEGEDLESRINALSESLSYAPSTTVNSVANPITFTGQFRARNGWTFDRDFGANDFDDDGSFVDARFLVGITYEFDRNVVTHISLQANGLFENSDTPAGNDQLSDIDLYEGWIHVNNLFGRKEFSVRTGRQEIVLGNEFQFGNNDFFSGETHDATHWMWQAENFNLHFIWAKMDLDNGGAFSTRNHPYIAFGTDNGYDDDEMYALYFTLKSLENAEIDLYWIYMNGSAGGSVGTLGNPLDLGVAGGNFFFHTVGVRIGGTFAVAEGLDYNVEFAYQFGDVNQPGDDIDVENFAVEAEVGITFNADNNFRVFIRFLFAEGGDADESGYIPLFTERHAMAGTGGTQNYRARYGLMDIVPLTNVITAQAGLHFDPRDDWTIGATFIWAEYDEEIASEDEIGFEIDLFADYRYSDQTTIGFGLGLFFADDGSPLAGGGVVGGGDDDLAVLIYTQVVVVF